jgi:ribonuclease HII
VGGVFPRVASDLGQECREKNVLYMRLLACAWCGGVVETTASPPPPGENAHTTSPLSFLIVLIKTLQPHNIIRLYLSLSHEDSPTLLSCGNLYELNANDSHLSKTPTQNTFSFHLSPKTADTMNTHTLPEKPSTLPPESPPEPTPPQPLPKRHTGPCKSPKSPLRMQSTVYDVECGVDEVARGCLFGRVYAGAVVWRKPCVNGESLLHPVLPKGVVIRDSKTMSRLQRAKAAAWIRQHALAVGTAYRDERYIDTHNIRQAAHDAMADAVKTVQQCVPDLTRALIDGDGFSPTGQVAVTAPAAPLFRNPTPVSPPHQQCSKPRPSDVQPAQATMLPPHTCVVKGDATFFTIACAAIVAKVAHDEYIHELCQSYPELDERYALCSNMGYGSKAHREGLLNHGASPFHRRTFRGVPGYTADA